jgi:exodeoxyribonuclease V beta subunit
VLVRTNKQAEIVQCALQETGVPVVLTGRTDVFATPAALEWQLLLEALEQPHRTTRVRRLALGAFVGRTADQLAVEDSEQLGLRLRVWARVLEERGVSALFEAVCLSEAVQPRVLSHTGGDRLLTDLRHLTEALHEAALEGQLGLTALLGWLRRAARTPARRARRSAAAGWSPTPTRSRSSPCTPARAGVPRRLVPFGWDRWAPDAPSTAVFHDAQDRRVSATSAASGSPTGCPRPGAQAGRGRRRAAPDVRRADRARRDSWVLWWAGSKNTPERPAAPAAAARRPRRRTAASVPVPSDDDALRTFQARAAASVGRAAGGGAGGPAAQGLRPAARHGPPAEQGGVRPRARHPLAPYLLHRPHRGRARRRTSARKRARGRGEGR